MKKSNLENRIKELELELRNLNSSARDKKEDVVHFSVRSIDEMGTKLASLTNCIPVFVAYVNAESLQYEFVNDLYVKSFGIPREEIIGKHVKDVIGEANYKYALKSINEVLSGKSCTYENKFNLNDGKRFLQVNFTPVFDKDSKVVGIAVVNFDITDRKKLEQEVSRRAQELLTLFDTVNSPIFTLIVENEGKYRFKSINQSFCNLTGLKKEQVVGKMVDELIPEPSLTRVIEKFKQAINENKQIVWDETSDYPIGRLTGEVSISPVYDDNRQCLSLIGSVHDITLQKQAEELLRKNEEKLRFYLDNSPMAIIECNSDFVIIRWTGESEKIFGWRSEEVVGRKISDLNIVYKDDINAVDAIKQKIMNGGFSQILSCNRNYRKDGRVIICEWYNIVSNDENGEMQSVLSKVLDITNRKQIEDENKHTEEYFRSIFDNNPSAICIIESDDTISMVNDEYCKLSGFNREELVGTRWTQQIQSDDFERFKEYLIRKQKEPNYSNEKFEIIFYKKNGEVKHLLSSLTILSNSKILASFLDITDTSKAQTILAESSQFNSQIINNVDNGIIVFDKELRLKVWNPFMENLTGISSSFVIGKYESEVFSLSKEVKIAENFRSALEGHSSAPSNFQFNFPDSGKSGWAISKTNPLRDVFGEVSGVIVTIYEITGLKQFESELIMAKEKAEESDRLKTAFLTNMSHEIRTPMNGIIGFSELLKEPALTLEEQNDFIQTIQISGARLLNTINNIIDISKIESGLVFIDIKETNVNDKLDFAYKFFLQETRSKGLQFCVKKGLSDKDSVIKTDNEKVYGVITNLIKNAIKFTYDGSIEAGYVKSGEFLKFYVKDTGVGIPKKQQKIIFERFRQGSESMNRGFEGSGLGLSISQSYIEMLGGNLWVESEEGIGSTFYFTLPYNTVSERPAEKEIVTTKQITAELKKLKTLIVEDDEISYSLLVRNVQKFSSEVIHAIDGIQAIEACRNNPDLNLILMDIRMPLMSGLEATRQIRQFNKDVIIIAQTAYGFSSDSEKALEAGCNDYISKPINKTQMLGLIRKYCGI